MLRRTFPLLAVMVVLWICAMWYTHTSFSHTRDDDDEPWNIAHRPSESPAPSVLVVCNHTVQGAELVSDNVGRVCLREKWNSATGCCPHNSGRGCRECSGDEDFCCIDFEWCVACCIANNRSIFEWCMHKCRTSSLSLDDYGRYRNATHRHCFRSVAVRSPSQRPSRFFSPTPSIRPGTTVEFLEW